MKNQVAREELKEQEAKRKRSARLQQQNKQRWLKYQEQLRSELAARYFHGVVSAGGESFSNTKSMNFDGTDDYIELNSPTSIQSLTSQITISFWIKAPRIFSTNYYTPLSKIYSICKKTKIKSQPSQKKADPPICGSAPLSKA